MLMPCKAAHAPPITLVHQIAPNLADDNNLLSDNRSGVTTSIVTECTSLNFLAVDDDAAPPEYINMQPNTPGNSETSPMTSWKPFAPDESSRFLPSTSTQGLNPSPRISMTYQLQSEDPLQESDLCAKIFGVNTSRRQSNGKLLSRCSVLPRLYQQTLKSSSLSVTHAKKCL